MPPGDRSLSTLLQDIAGNVQDILRSEVRLARTEIAGEFFRARHHRQLEGERPVDQTTDQIENHIEDERKDLRSNLQELEARVRSATDWRRFFGKYTGAMIAAAFGGGMLVSIMIGRRSASQSRASSAAARGMKR